MEIKEFIHFAFDNISPWIELYMNFSYSELLLELISKLVSFDFEFIQDKRKMLLNVFRNCLEVFEIVKTLYHSQDYS